MRDDFARGRKSRVAVAATAAIATVVAFASLGGISLAKSAIALAQYQYGKNRIVICHKGKNTISIPVKAWPAHLRHHDTLGKCANGHTKNKGKHKGESHHAPNPASGTGDDSQSSSTQGNDNGKGHGHG